MDLELSYSIPIKFVRPFGSTVAEVHIKFQPDKIIITPNFMALSLHEIW